MNFTQNLINMSLHITDNGKLANSPYTVEFGVYFLTPNNDVGNVKLSYLHL